MKICASATSVGAPSGELGKLTLLKIVMGLFKCFILLINYEGDKGRSFKNLEKS